MDENRITGTARNLGGKVEDGRMKLPRNFFKPASVVLRAMRRRKFEE